MTTNDVLDKYFKGERTLYFQSTDAHNSIEGDTYLRYKKEGHVELWFGGNNGEMCLLCTTDPERLDAIIKAMIYP